MEYKDKGRYTSLVSYPATQNPFTFYKLAKDYDIRGNVIDTFAGTGRVMLGIVKYLSEAKKHGNLYLNDVNPFAQYAQKLYIIHPLKYGHKIVFKLNEMFFELYRRLKLNYYSDAEKYVFKYKTYCHKCKSYQFIYKKDRKYWCKKCGTEVIFDSNLYEEIEYTEKDGKVSYDVQYENELYRYAKDQLNERNKEFTVNWENAILTTGNRHLMISRNVGIFNSFSDYFNDRIKLFVLDYTKALSQLNIEGYLYDYFTSIVLSYLSNTTRMTIQDRTISFSNIFNFFTDNYVEFNPVSPYRSDIKVKLKTKVSSLSDLLEKFSFNSQYVKAYQSNYPAQEIAYESKYFDWIVTDPPYFDFVYSFYDISLMQLQALQIMYQTLYPQQINEYRADMDFIKFYTDVVNEQYRILKYGGRLAVIINHSNAENIKLFEKMYEDAGFIKEDERYDVNVLKSSLTANLNETRVEKAKILIYKK